MQQSCKNSIGKRIKDIQRPEETSSYIKTGARSFTKKYPPTISHKYSKEASTNGLAPAFLNLSILVSAPNAVIAIVSKKVSRLLIKAIKLCGNRSKELKPITAKHAKAD